MKKAKVILTSLFLLLLFFSCITEKKRAKICSTCPVINYTKDSIVVVKKDTTIYVNSEPVLIELESPCSQLCDSLNHLKDFYYTHKDKGIRATITSKNGKLIVNCKADSLQNIIKGLITDKENWTKNVQTKIIQEDCKKSHQTKFDGFTFYWFIISLIFLGIKYLPKLILLIKELVRTIC